MKFIKLNHIALLTIFVGSYYFLYSLGTTNKIAPVIQISNNEVIKPNLIERLHFNQILESNSKETIIAELDKQENEIWQNLEKIIHINKEECNRLKSNEWAETYSKTEKSLIMQYEHVKKLSEKNYNIACEVLSDCGINPETITITSWDHPSAAAATDNALFINEDIFSPLSLSIKKFALAHEITHMIKKDYSTKYIIEKIKITNKIDSDELTHTLALLTQFTEARADIIATLRNSEYAQGQVQFMINQLETLGNPEYKEYPTNSLRLEIGKKILALHTTNQPVVS